MTKSLENQIRQVMSRQGPAPTEAPRQSLASTIRNFRKPQAQQVVEQAPAGIIDTTKAAPTPGEYVSSLEELEEVAVPVIVQPLIPDPVAAFVAGKKTIEEEILAEDAPILSPRRPMTQRAMSYPTPVQKKATPIPLKEAVVAPVVEPIVESKPAAPMPDQPGKFKSFREYHAAERLKRAEYQLKVIDNA